MDYMYVFFIITILFQMNSPTTTNSIHQFKIRALDSEEIIDLSAYKGKKILLVNVASKCGFTYQYEDLEKLYQTYKDKLVVIGFPCNQFLGQEPGSEEKIATFCSTTYGVTFPMSEKIKVKGRNAHPIYQWLTDKSLNGKSNYRITWNFNKFLIDEQGLIIDHFPAKVKPLDSEITKHL